jgi:hypothetical protein
MIWRDLFIGKIQKNGRLTAEPAVFFMRKRVNLIS